ncbi:TetR family transcriptional regulator [Pseudoduganella sp. DS3]|uniref:TetR family transcriptional regulator n=1 Tax=Pseudoduganella guangdongensis TaxID=2692179 RepID=A0A6N9HN76_9BURK|nr:TetR/AcrR family transcriptional regulator [Pseudoduganella guangdongensis]MYN05118.1 TetR family transcriptional regulator [Pseudoduganella guangdongensis]
MRVSREQAAQNRERIVETASRLFREKGYDGIGVADLMKCAGLTHGGFYGHFASKEDLLAEAFGKAMQGSAEKWRTLLAAAPANPRAALAHMYLTAKHRDNPGGGCALAALGPDVSRVGPEVRQAMADSFQSQIAALAQALPGAPAQQRRAAITTYAAMVGALVLARAVADRKQSDEILAAVLATLEQGS